MAAAGADVDLSDISTKSMESIVDMPTQSPDILPEQEQAPEVKHKSEKINLFGVEIERIADGKTNETVYAVNEANILPEELDNKKLDRKFKRDEKNLFANAEPDRIHQDKVYINKEKHPNHGVFYQDNKNLSMNYLAMDYSELDDLLKGLVSKEEREAYIKQTFAGQEQIASQSLAKSI